MPPADWRVAVRRPGLGAGCRRPVVPALFADRAARPQLGQPRGARRLPDDPAVLVRPRRRRVPGRRRARSGQRPARDELPDQAGPRRAASRRAAIRSGTATRCTRSTPSGGRSSTSTTRRAPRSPRPGSTRPAAPRYASPRGSRPGVQLRPAGGAVRRRGVPTGHRRQPRARRSSRARPRPGSSPTTTSCGTPPATACPEPADPREKQRRGLAADRRPRPDARRRARPPAGAGGDAADARPARVRLPLPGRGARAARGRRPPAERRQDPAFFRNPGVETGRDGCRVPLPWTQRRPVVRVRRRRRAPAAAAWFAELAVEAQEDDPASTLQLYRRALEVRRRSRDPSGWRGRRRSARRSCGSDATARGRSSSTSGIRRPRCPPARCSSRAAPFATGCFRGRRRPGSACRRRPEPAASADPTPGAHPAGGRARARMRSSTNSPGLIGAKPTSTTSSPASRSRCVIVSWSHRTKYASRGE